MSNRLVVLGLVVGIAIAFLAGRRSAGDGRLLASASTEPLIAEFRGGALGADYVRDVVGGASDVEQLRAAIEQLVRVRLLAMNAEKAGVHLTPEFLRRYSEELARIQVEKAFEEPFKKQLPTEDEVRKFFRENEARLGRPERVRLAHVALLAARSDVAARTARRADAERALTELRRSARDEYGFGRLAMAISEDPLLAGSELR